MSMNLGKAKKEDKEGERCAVLFVNVCERKKGWKGRNPMCECPCRAC